MPKLSDRTVLWLAIVVVATALLHLLMPLPSDVSWLIVVNEKLLDGERLYADVLETNPPMAVWLYTLPVVLERMTGLAAEPWVVLETTLSAMVSLLLARVIGEAEMRVPLALVAAVLLPLPVNTFAQREHFVLFALLPWLALATRRYEGASIARWSPAAAGLGLAIALAIKPYFVIVVALVVLTVSIRRRSWRVAFVSEHWIALAFLALYAVVIAAAYPAYFTDVLPAVAVLYAPLRMPWVALVTQPEVLLVMFVLVVGGLLYRRNEGRTPVPVILAAIAGCLIVYLLQGKGWAYHLLPGTTLAIVAGAGMTCLTPPSRLRLAARIALGVVVGIPALLSVLVAWARPDPLLTALSRDGPGRSLLFITSDIGLANPASRQLGDRLVNSAPMLWRATGAVILGHTASPDRQAILYTYEQQDYRLLAHDLDTHPDIVLADTMGFVWLLWAKRDPAVSAALAAYADGGKIATHGTELTVLKRAR